MENINLGITEIWCIVGDVNDVLSTEDMIHGVSVTEAEIKDFFNFLNNFFTFNMYAVGKFFIWVNGRMYRKIDRVICNFNWMRQYSSIISEFKEVEYSDYYSIVMEIM